MTLLQKILLTYYLVVNIAIFFVMFKDKRSATKKKRRVPERVLMTFSSIGGASGMLFSMVLLHHKTAKPKFFVTVPILFIVTQIALIFMLTY